MPKEIGVCGNGLLYLKEASWIPNNSGGITVYLKAGRVTVNRFEYKIVYNILEINKERMILTKEKTLLQKETSF